MFFLILVVLGIVWALYRTFKDEFSPLRKIPYASSHVPILGHAMVFLRERNHLKVLRDWSEKHGPIFRYNRGFGDTRVFLADPDLIKHVTVTNSKNYLRSQFIRKVMPSIGNGLFSSNGKDHTLQRKMIIPAFHYSNLGRMVNDFCEVSNSLITLWTDKVSDSSEGSSEVSIQTDLAHLALDIIGRCAFGFNFNTVLSGESEISRAFSVVIKGVNFGRLMKKRLIPFYDSLPLDDNIKEQKSFEKTDETVLKIIRERRKRREEGKADSKGDLLGLLMDQRDEDGSEAMDDELLRAQVFTFMLAGHETTSVSLTWTLYELARHPEIAEEIRRESQRVIPNLSDLSWEKLAEMKFLGNVIKESLRRHSPAAMMFRVAKENDVIGGYEIPKGTYVGLGVDVVHNSPKFWKDPHAFDPNRFDEKDDTHPPIHPYAFIPFSAGPRSCIGNKFALAEMKVVLISLLRQFAFEEVPGFTVTPLVRLTARPDPPMRLRIRKLNH